MDLHETFRKAKLKKINQEIKQNKQTTEQAATTKTKRTLYSPNPTHF